jgi:leucyl/phenylalanyl-tRNA---protein transferase
MPVFRLRTDDLSFPPPSFAEGDGLLAVGGDLSPERLVIAYQSGVFPWFEEDGTFYWFSPDPRCVLYPAEVKVHKSMRSIFNKQKFRYSIDTEFEAVMEACGQTPRNGEYGTWITENFISGYYKLHSLGIAHSVEVWQDDDLVGGLYGVSIGKMFFGESMFSRVENASKAGFITLVRALAHVGFTWVDCQVGARSIPRADFLDLLERNIYYRTLIGKWQFNAAGGVELQQDPLSI